MIVAMCRLGKGVFIVSEGVPVVRGVWCGSGGYPGPKPAWHVATADFMRAVAASVRQTPLALNSVENAEPEADENVSSRWQRLCGRRRWRSRH
jgi:hypothetical protein